MRFLHTADWHVGKTLKGHSRLEEQERVLREIVAIARVQEVDAVLVAGDLYDTAAPSAEAQKLVIRTLTGLANTGAEVI
ncbi:MAG: exonuclease subunit SbcD, partial [Acidimicrobiales bacterium]|nr:exonuclease subunit SbcD [Acidimicrobiales bacterium]